MTHLEHHTPTFAELGVRDEIVRALADRGIEHAFAIQELTLPLALAGDDLIGQARTGMGKTFAFGVPLLHRITNDTERPLSGAPRALIVVPTRELCIQVYEDLSGAAKNLRADTAEGGDRKFSVVSIYGGRPYEPQIEALRKGADVVVGTPGRLLDLAQQGHLQLGGISALVLDEADEMLDLGFLPDIERILRLTPDTRQSMLFSATMPGPIITLARTFMNQPTHIRAEAAQSSQTHDTTEQFVYRAHALDKVEMVSRILQADGRGATMVFTRTKRTAQKVADELAERGFKVGAVHGDLGQGAREHALKAFRTGEVDVLVATDVAGQDGYRGHAGRLGRAQSLDADRQGPGPGVPGPGRDLLEFAASLRRARNPHGHQGFHRRPEEVAQCQAGTPRAAAGRRQAAPDPFPPADPRRRERRRPRRERCGQRRDRGRRSRRPGCRVSGPFGHPVRNPPSSSSA